MFVDANLAARLDRAEGRSSAEFVEARARREPDGGAAWMEVDGTFAMFDGADSPLTQTFGLGLSGPVAEGTLDRLEAFFDDRSAPVFHEVSPLADRGLPALLNGRGYRPLEYSSVLFRPIRADLSLEGHGSDRWDVRPVTAKDADRWGRTAGEGWREYGDDLVAFMVDAGRIYKDKANTDLFLAELEGEPAATGALCRVDGVALLAGASTRVEYRRRGAQLALLESRLRHAASQGCDVAMLCAEPGSASQRNAERHGFRIAYTRTKWERAPRH